ncbi:hypothetical protein H6G00_06740 [Leptolyngbya sp. FACHB-541]|uniref:hypothetical protein n=1 Tax=Leptolyngbya sp. FACHB-541 TaxID=2692810 RepID=UPI001682D58F|nr:hypothetical protein [Leptolyngbya sp. FACHB-541]MBD1996310.1 hypothetical protein [Leptolyngbya sp. FACHB-541]
MKILAFFLPLATISFVALGIAAYTELQMEPQPLPLEVAPSTTPTDAIAQSQLPETVTTPSDTSSWSAVLGDTSAPEGWQVTPCENPTLLCVYENGEILGTVILFSQPIPNSEFEAMLADSQGEPIAALRAWIESQYNSIERDRTLNDSTTSFVAETPEEVTVGSLPGLRYGYTTTHANGALIDHAYGYVATDGTTLYGIVTGVISRSPAGSFSSNEAAQQFAPHLAEIVARLKL